MKFHWSQNLPRKTSIDARSDMRVRLRRSPNAVSGMSFKLAPRCPKRPYRKRDVKMSRAPKMKRVKEAGGSSLSAGGWV